MNRMLVVFLFVLVLVGCASQPYSYYMLRANASEADITVNGPIGLIPVAVPGWLYDSRLSWSDGKVQLFRLNSERWGTDLGEEINRVLSTNLSRQLKGENVSIGPWFGDQRPDLVLKMELENLVMNEASVELTACWQLQDKQGQVLVQHGEQVWVSEVMAAEDGSRLAQGISEVLSAIAGDMIEAVRVQPEIHIKKMEP